jgi:hypothetical protein
MEKMSDKGPFFAQGEPSAAELEARVKVLEVFAAEIKLSLPPEFVAEVARLLLTCGGGDMEAEAFVGAMLRAIFTPKKLVPAMAGLRGIREALEAGA